MDDRAPTEWTALSESSAATEELGRILGAHARGGECLALEGELGAGKTCLVRGLARGLGSGERVTSPSFTLHGRYEGRLVLDHVDAYFRERVTGFLDEGGEEFLGAPGAVAAIEWAEQIRAYLPADRLEAHLAHVGEEHRRVLLRALGAASRAWLVRATLDLAREFRSGK